jgi:hypothetical protein
MPTAQMCVRSADAGGPQALDGGAPMSSDWDQDAALRPPSPHENKVVKACPQSIASASTSSLGPSSHVCLALPVPAWLVEGWTQGVQHIGPPSGTYQESYRIPPPHSFPIWTLTRPPPAFHCKASRPGHGARTRERPNATTACRDSDWHLITRAARRPDQQNSG